MVGVLSSIDAPVCQEHCAELFHKRTTEIWEERIDSFLHVTVLFQLACRWLTSNASRGC